MVGPSRPIGQDAMTAPPERRLSIWRLQQLERLALAVVSADADLGQSLAALCQNAGRRVFEDSYYEERSARGIARRTRRG